MLHAEATMDSGYCYELQFMSRSLETGHQLSHQQYVIRQAYVLKRQVDWPANRMLTGPICARPRNLQTRQKLNAKGASRLAS